MVYDFAFWIVTHRDSRPTVGIIPWISGRTEPIMNHRVLCGHDGKILEIDLSAIASLCDTMLSEMSSEVSGTAFSLWSPPP